MCHPAVLLVASLALTAVSTMQQYNAAQDQAQYAKEVAEQDAIINERAAKDAIKRGAREERLHALRVQQEKSTARSSLAAGGFDVNFGSSLTKQADIQAMGDIESGTIRSNAHREAYGIRVQGVRDQARAEGEISAAKNRGTSALIGGAAKLTSTAYSGFAPGGGFSGGGSLSTSARAARAAPVTDLSFSSK